MKKLVYLITAFFAITLTGCEDPMEDIHNEIDAETTTIITGDVAFTMSDDDYDFLELNYGNFNNTDDAKNMIPDTAQYNNFDDMDQIYTFLDTKYENPSDRFLVSLTYKFYDGSARTLNNGFLYNNETWNFIQGFTDDEYEEMGESYPNFSSEEEAEEKIPTYLKEKYFFKNRSVGDIESVMYKLYTTDVDDLDGDGRKDDRTTYSYIMYFDYDGTAWNPYTNEVQESVQFGHDGNVWVPDNTIKYRLTSADIALIESSFIDKYPGPADNVGFFGSFDRRSGSSNYWSDEMLIEAFNVVLDNLSPDAENDQKYILTYLIYNGSTQDESMGVIKADGEWVKN